MCVSVRLVPCAMCHAEPRGRSVCGRLTLVTMAVEKTKAAKALAASGGGKGKKKKWSKGKVKDKAANLVLFDEEVYAKLYKEVPKFKLITTSIMSDRLKINGSLARHAIKELMAKGSIRMVTKHSAQGIYTRATNA